MAKINQVINDGGVVVFPTETVYGLGCDAKNEKAVARIYELKKRDNKPLSIIVPDLATAKKYALFSPREEALARQYWPGPLTLILKKRTGTDLADGITLGTANIGIRIPAYPPLLDVMVETNKVLVATSVNNSGEKEYMTAEEIRQAFPKGIDYIWEDDAALNGTASTVVFVKDEQPVIIRQGSIEIK